MMIIKSVEAVAVTACIGREIIRGSYTNCTYVYM